MTGYDVDLVRKDFPILSRTLVGDVPLVYLDSANTSQKPQAVIDAVSEHYELHNANVARAVHQLGAESTQAYENARSEVASFIGASRPEEVVFTKNASEALNLVARVLGDSHGAHGIGEGDEIVITELEHHSNIVPWQLLAERTGARLRWFGITDEGRLDLAGDFGTPADELIDERTRVVSVAYVSNSLGTILPIAEIVRRAREVGALVVVDASQAVPQMPVDVSTLGADLVVFTGHKMLGPTGIGVMWGRYDLLASLPPFLGGGEMIETVTMARSTFAEPPHRFEAGTPPIAPAIGLGAAVRYLRELGMENVATHERDITHYLLGALSQLPAVKVMGPTTVENRGGAVSFTVDGVHPHDVAQMLDAFGIAVRAGHHCAKPAHQRFGIQSTTRVSPYLYTTTEEIDTLIDGLCRTLHFFGAPA